MDEPFGALDEQTRMVLGEDLSVLLSRSNKTIVFVTHSLGEAVFLADRVAVFSARPGTIKQIITVDEPHPRKPSFMTAPNSTRSATSFTACCTTKSAKPCRRPRSRAGATAKPVPPMPTESAHESNARVRHERRLLSLLVQTRIPGDRCCCCGIWRRQSGASAAYCCPNRSTSGISSSTSCLGRIHPGPQGDARRTRGCLRNLDDAWRHRSAI